VTEHDDLDRQLLLLAKGEADQLEEANERQVDEGESHDSIITVRIRRTKVHVEGLDNVFGTDRVRPERLHAVPVIDGLARRCASQEGNALAVCCRLGLAEDERVRLLADSLLSWQWPDGGWNCDPKASGRRSSFHESLAPAWGLHEYALATGDAAARAAAERAAELFLSHRLFRSLSTGKPVRADWLVLHYPPYWHYDILQGLHILVRLGRAADPRLEDATDVLERRRLANGTWSPGGYWWKPPGAGKDATRGQRAWNAEVVNWGRSGPNEMVTLNAMRVLRAVGRHP